MPLFRPRAISGQPAQGQADIVVHLLLELRKAEHKSIGVNGDAPGVLSEKPPGKPKKRLLE